MAADKKSSSYVCLGILCLYLKQQYFEPLFSPCVYILTQLRLSLCLTLSFHQMSLFISSVLIPSVPVFCSFPYYIFYHPPTLSSAFIWRLVSQCRSTIWTWNTPETHTQSTTHETHANWETSFLLLLPSSCYNFSFFLPPLIRFLAAIV